MIVGFTCGRFAGRLEASIAPAGFCDGVPLAPLVGAAAAGFRAGFATGFDAGVATGFAAGFAAAFAAGFAADLATGFAADFSAAGFSAGLEPPINRASRPFFFSAMCRHVTNEIGNTAAVAPLVVIPGHDLHELIANHHRAERVDD